MRLHTLMLCLNFLANGEPPVSIGFDSMGSRDSEAMTAMALTALQ